MPPFPRARRRRAPVLLAALLLAPLGAATAQLDGTVWHDEAAGATIRFAAEPGGTLVGRLVAVRDTADADGRPPRDANNPDPALRDRPVLGLPMLTGMRPEGETRWGGGTIYDPRNGKTYRATLTLAHPDTLQVRGYVKVGFVKLGRTSRWTRVAEAPSDAAAPGAR